MRGAPYWLAAEILKIIGNESLVAVSVAKATHECSADTV